MTQLSKHRLRPAVRKMLINKFFKATHKHRSTEGLENYLQHLLTPVEIETFAKRLEIFKLRRERLTYGEIWERVKVTGATINKMNNVLLKGNDKFVVFIDKLIEEDKREEAREKESKYFKSSKQIYRQRTK